MSNTGDADLANCQVSDEIFLADLTCPTEGNGTTVPVTPPEPFDLPAGGQQVTVTATVGPLNADAANDVEVTCDIVGSGDPPKTITADDCDECGGLASLWLIKQDTGGVRQEGVGFSITGPCDPLSCVTDAAGECHFEKILPGSSPGRRT